MVLSDKAFLHIPFAYKMPSMENAMTTIEQFTGIDPQAKAELQEACNKLAGGVPFTDDEKAKARERINRIREENRKLFGESDIAVQLIRETRDIA